jgi:hypothetical protein
MALAQAWRGSWLAVDAVVGHAAVLMVYFDLF